MRVGGVGARVSAGGLRGLLALPGWALRPLAGPRVVWDGQEMAPAIRVLMRMVSRQMPRSVADLPRIRKASAAGGPVLAGGARDGVRTQDMSVEGAAGPLAARLYVPTDVVDPGGLLVFFHGGGWVLGGVESHEAVCRRLAAGSGVRVLSVEYRLMPEHAFPAAHEDALAVFRGVVADPGRFGAVAGRVAVGGDSAGANLAAAVAHEGVRSGAAVPSGVVLMYPSVDLGAGAGVYASKDALSRGFVLDADVWWGSGGLLESLEPHVADRRLSVVLDEAVEGMPPVFVATCGFDPLRDEGEAYAQRLRGRGVDVTVRRFGGLFHGFASFAVVERRCGAALDEVAGAVGRLTAL